MRPPSETIPSILAITGDLQFLSTVREAATGRSVRHVFSLDDGLKILARDRVEIVILDRDLDEENWPLLLSRLHAVAPQGCILLASRVADEYLWNDVVRHKGYDVLVKPGTVESIAGTLAFAAFWTHSRLP